MLTYFPHISCGIISNYRGGHNGAVLLSDRWFPGHSGSPPIGRGRWDWETTPGYTDGRKVVSATHGPARKQTGSSLGSSAGSIRAGSHVAERHRVMHYPAGVTPGHGRQILELHEFFTRLSRSGKCPSRKLATVAVCLETVPVWGLLENSGKNHLWGYKNAMTY